MSSYLDLVNLVILESASEQDVLTEDTWDSAEAGRRIYPRIKRNVAQAWKNIQMDRDQWEFKAVQISTIIYPRVRVSDGFRAAGEPPSGSVFKGTDSVMQFTVRSVNTTAGDWTDGTAEAIIEFGDYTGSQLIPDDVFTEVSPVLDDGFFTYLGKGGYTFREINPLIRSFQWSTFTAVQEGTSLRPVMYIPYDNWYYNDFSYTTSSLNVPMYVSQDFAGEVVFYPQTLNPFRIDFICDTAPQILTDWDDVPYNLDEEFHDWIAWEALKLYALYDKNSDLYAYAKVQADGYAQSAERSLMPLVSWGRSTFNDWPAR